MAKIRTADLKSKGLLGTYSQERNLILIDKTLKGRERKRVLEHELGHEIFCGRFPKLSQALCLNGHVMMSMKFWNMVWISYAVLILTAIFLNDIGIFVSLGITFPLLAIPVMVFLVYEFVIIENLYRWARKRQNC